MPDYRKELFREMMKPAPPNSDNGGLREWTRLMKEKEGRIFELMGRESAQRLSRGNSPLTHEDHLIRTLKKGFWVPPFRPQT
jgi:hypothetical protein